MSLSKSSAVGGTNGKLREEAVIFDMDGVIVDSEPHHVRIFQAICSEAGVDLNTGPRIQDYIGRSDAEFWTDFMKHHKLPWTLERVLANKRDRVVECFRRERPFFPGLMDLVQRLAPVYRLALASGSDRALVDAVLEIGNLSKFFKVRVTSSEVPCGKPKPDIFLKTAALLGVEPSACWVIEDSKPGIAAGLAAGMKVIAVTNTHPAEELCAATHVVESCGEIETILCGTR